MKYIALILLAGMVGCTGSVPKPPALVLQNDKWEETKVFHSTPDNLTVAPKVEEIQVTKYRYSCPTGYRLGWYGYENSWQGGISSDETIRSYSTNSEPMMDEPNDSYTCLLIKPKKDKK